MPKFIVRVRVYNDRELQIYAKDEDDAEEKAELRLEKWDIVDHEILDVMKED